MIQTIPSFYAEVSEKRHFFSAKTFEKYIVCKDFCIAHHDNKTCFLPACNNHNKLFGEIVQLLHKLDTFCFTYQHVDCLYTLLKTDSAEKFLQRVEMCLIMCKEQFLLTRETEEWTKCRVLQKKLLRKKFKQAFMSPKEKLSKRKNQPRPVIQCLQKELKKPKSLNLNWN